MVINTLERKGGKCKGAKLFLSFSLALIHCIACFMLLLLLFQLLSFCIIFWPHTQQKERKEEKEQWNDSGGGGGDCNIMLTCHDYSL